MAPHDSVDCAIEVGKHFLFFLAIVNSFDSPRRVRIALGLYALSAIAPGWGTFDYWRHDIGLVEGFRGRWLGVLADPNHDAMALVGAVPLCSSWRSDTATGGCCGSRQSWASSRASPASSSRTRAAAQSACCVQW